MAKVRKTPAIDLAAFAREHVTYEVNMFLASFLIAQNSDIAGNLKAECFALHLRNLMDFFYLDSPRSDDVIAADYVTNWPTIRPALTPTLDRARIRANKEMAHLTTSRITGTPKEKEWNMSAIRNDLKPVVADFLGSADMAAISTELATAMRQI